MAENILNIVCSLSIIVAFAFGIVAWVTDDDYRKVVALLLAFVGFGGFFVIPGLDKWQHYQDNERQSKIQHLQSEVPKDVSLQKLDSQLTHRDIDLEDADSVSYSDNTLKVFFSRTHIFWRDDHTTWSVKLQDNTIQSISRSQN